MLIFCKQMFAYLLTGSQRRQLGVQAVAVLHCGDFRDTGERAMDSLKTLYQTHIAKLQQRAQQVLARNKLDARFIPANY